MLKVDIEVVSYFSPLSYPLPPHRGPLVTDLSPPRRAQLFPTVLTVRPCADAPDRCIVEGTFNYDLKLRLVPMRVIEGATFSAWRQLRTQLLRCAEHVRA